MPIRLIEGIARTISEVEKEWEDNKISGYKLQHISSRVIKTVEDWYAVERKKLRG